MTLHTYSGHAQTQKGRKRQAHTHHTHANPHRADALKDIRVARRHAHTHTHMHTHTHAHTHTHTHTHTLQETPTVPAAHLAEFFYSIKTSMLEL